MTSTKSWGNLAKEGRGRGYLQEKKSIILVLRNTVIGFSFIVRTGTRTCEQRMWKGYGWSRHRSIRPVLGKAS